MVLVNIVKRVNKNVVAKISQQIQRCFNEQKMFETFDEQNVK